METSKLVFRSETTKLVLYEQDIVLNPYHPKVSFHIETSHLVYSPTMQCNEMKCNTGLKWVNYVTYSVKIGSIYS